MRIYCLLFVIWLGGCAGPVPAPVRPGTLRVVDSQILVVDLDDRAENLVAILMRKLGPDLGRINSGWQGRVSFDEHDIVILLKDLGNNSSQIIFEGQHVNGGPPRLNFLGPWVQAFLNELGL